MSDPKDPTKSTEATPEQLLKMLDLQIAAKRERRREGSRSRAALIVGAIVLIVGGALAAFLILQQMIADLPQHERPQVSPVRGEYSQ